MDDVVEMTLSRAVEVTHTDRIRGWLREAMATGPLDRPPVELVHFNVFIHCVSGSGHHMVDFEDVEVQTGTAIWVRPGQVQRWSSVDDGFDAEVLVFSSSAVPELPLFDRMLGRTSRAELGVDSAHVKRHMDWMAADLAANEETSVPAAVVGVILRLFARNVESLNLSDDPRHVLATSFVESIDANIGQRSVTWHAERIGASTRSVSRATIETLDQRPKEVLDSRVILEAQRRLAWAEDDIATIARSLNFSEASNFTKFFRARTGMSPSKFRDSSQQIDAVVTN